MKLANCSFHFVAVLLTIFFCPALYGQVPADQLILLSRQKDTSSLGSAKITTPDSATIVSPEFGQILSRDSILFEIIPRVAVDSVLLFVRHSLKTDTLQIHYAPPYRSFWDARAVPDQDQFHLQFGYTLFCTDGTTIQSGPLPHRWILDRGRSIRKVRCIARQQIKPDSVNIDGDLNEWDRHNFNPIRNMASFAFQWSGGHIFFAIEVFGTPVDPSDFVELHIDMHSSRTHFADIEHRTIRFSPFSRSNSFTIQRTESGFIAVDSISARISREMEWRTVRTPSGYRIEARIPVFVLSSLEFPPRTIGANISILHNNNFVSWSGAGQYTRYSPRTWGEVRLRPAMVPLITSVYIFAITLFIIILVIVALGIRHYRHETIERKRERMGLPQSTRLIFENIGALCHHTDVTIEQVASASGMDVHEVESRLREDLDSSFEQCLRFERVRKARECLKSDVPIESIAAMCGFSDENDFRETFRKTTGATPASYQETIRAEILEEDGE